jgi:hypothetical protein
MCGSWTSAWVQHNGTGEVVMLAGDAAGSEPMLLQETEAGVVVFQERNPANSKGLESVFTRRFAEGPSGVCLIDAGGTWIPIAELEHCLEGPPEAIFQANGFALPCKSVAPAGCPSR